MKRIAIIMGSKSDYTLVEGAVELSKRFPVECSVDVISAHRCMDRLRTKIEEIDSDESTMSVVGVAGGAAHLPGVIAAMTVKPVIGVPVPTSFMGGLDSLLSIAQMPSGIPVATVAAGKSGVKNAVLLALEIIALQDPAVKDALVNYRGEMRDQVEADSRSLRES